MSGEGVGLAEYARRSREWLETVAEPRPDESKELVWGEGSDSTAVFHDLTFEEERDVLRAAMSWQQKKFDAGFGAICWPVEFGGAGLDRVYEREFHKQEAAFVTPGGHETFSVTVNLIAPTIREFGSPEQHRMFVRRFLRAEELCCQLFSEPSAGSDLAGLSTKARRDGDDWVINGQKVWTSGAQFAAYGELIARSDPEASKHAGLTAFIVPMDTRGITVQPIRQMSGGSSFNEVFFDDVRIPDSLRLGPERAGWKVALTTLGFERAGSGDGRSVGGSWELLLALARHLGTTSDPLVRQRLASVYTTQRVRAFLGRRAEARVNSGQPPGPEGSVGKLLWTRGLSEMSDVASLLLGPRLIADTGEWGTWSWHQHVLGVPGYHIAGGSDEIQHNIIGERILGLPKEPAGPAGGRP